MNKTSLHLKLFGLFQVPMIGFAGPKIISLTRNEAVVRIKLNWRTRRRDIGSMYLGALAVGADIASGITAMACQDALKEKFSIIFKTLQCDFLKRPESDVYFTCTEGEAIEAMMKRALVSGKREAMPVKVVATAPDTLGAEPVATFTLILTVKKK